MPVIDYISVQDIETPVDTLANTPQVTPVDLGWVIINSITLRIPPGHMGLTGWALTLNGTRVIPWQQPNTFIVGDDESVPTTLGLEVDGGLEIVTYNLDTVYPHTHYARINYTPIANADLTSAPMSIIPLG